MPNTVLPDMVTDEQLTTMVNLLLPIPQKLGRKGLLNWQGIRTTNVALILADKKLQILSAKELDERGDLLRKKGAQIYRFEAPYYPHEDIIRPADVQNLRPLPGTSANELEMVEEVVADRLDEMTLNYEATYEWLLMNMLLGKIMNPDGTVLFDFYQLFQLPKQTVNFELNKANTNVLRKCEEVRRLVRKGLVGDVMSSVEVQVSQEFWDKLVHHASVKEAFERWEDGRALREGFEDKFTFGRITFEVEDREFDHNGDIKRFIGADKGVAYPLGTVNTFRGYLAPADMTPYVNTRGQRYYISTKDLDHYKGAELHMEARPVAFCQRLNALVEVTAQ